METKKIGVACFAGGAICTAVALIASPRFWWLGTLAGFAGGYLSYEFKEVLRAVPVALREAGRGVGGAGQALLAATFEVSAAIRLWLSKPHPFLYSSIGLALPMAIWLSLHPTSIGLLPTTRWGDVVTLAGCFWAALTLAVLNTLFALAFVGSRFGDFSYWRPFVDVSSDYESQLKVYDLEQAGYSEKPLGWPNFLRWTALGIGLILRFLVWTLPRSAAVFAWYLVKLIHSKKRLLCAVDGGIGGTLAGLIFRGHASSPAEFAAIVVFGGLLGAALGVANWEIVSKRILRVDTAA